ncbi:NADH-quinone oxidoreductase subunit C [Knoellia sp. Soil729]|uniref:NADH-quinone oxidoreductase subunit C n=1 Tax=Knoellia sp. Soil729 TaxID=1736394 RepID=UPI0009EBF862|nr:NADH-quinone oxidoreductase subunit C [Knoellia sp. Soil729]
MSDDAKASAEKPTATPPDPTLDSHDFHATDVDLTKALATDDTTPVQVGERRGMFGATRGGDTSGYGGLRTPILLPGSSQKPYGGYFDELTDTLGAALDAAGDTAYVHAVQRVVVDRGELTLHIAREALPTVARTMRDDPALRFEICTGVSGVHFPNETGRELHAVYHLLSITHNRRVRLEVTAPEGDPTIPSIVETYPAADWHERETWDMFGIIFEGHPALTRILMPDDWPGHPQRKDYPLGGIPVEYKGGTVPPPDERRSYN